MTHGKPPLPEHSTWCESAWDCSRRRRRCRLVHHCLATFGSEVGAAEDDVWALEPRKARPRLRCCSAPCVAPQPHDMAAAGVPPAGRPAAD